MSGHPTVTIAHALPGRLRAYLSTAPSDAVRFVESVRGHEGLEEVSLTPLTRSVLARFDPAEITGEEVVTRIALALSLGMGGVPVRILKTPESEILTNGAAFAGVLSGTALVLRLAGMRPGGGILEKAAALGTGAAVAEHGWREVRERGYFDPEVLSLTYLLAAVLRGDYARGAFITWTLAFGRHLLAPAPEAVEIRPVRRPGAEGEPERYELVVVPDAARQAPLFQVLRTMTRYLAPGGRSGAGMMEEMRAVSSAHGEMIEGLGWMRSGIPVHFQ